jgi:hypothetical protein
MPRAAESVATTLDSFHTSRLFWLTGADALK